MTLTARLTVDLDALVANWAALDRLSHAETAAVVKADGYGCSAARVGPALAKAGARTFFVAQPGEGVALRAALGAGPAIYILGGYPLEQGAEARLFAEANLCPVLNAPEQVAAWQAAGAPGPSALQLDTGMNRLGLEASELAALEIPLRTALIMSHMACADEPEHPQNAAQLAAFREMTAHLPADLPRSLAATGATLLGPDYHFDMVRPGIGLYGGLPFAAARPVVALHLPILQVRDVATGESVGYGASWHAQRSSRIATLSSGYADGLHRLLSNRATLYLEGRPCPLAGRVSMDLIGLDVTDAPDAAPGMLVEVLGPHQSVDTLAETAETIGYEVLTGLGGRYNRQYLGTA
ncbi:MAG: alanine racemase [Pseudomonadota bacterium]